MDWTKYLNKTLHVTMHENYGLKIDQLNNQPIFEIVFKTGKLIEANSEGLILESEREGTTVITFIPYKSIKCVEIFNV